MAGPIHGEVFICRPADEVFDFLADARNEPRYNHRMLRVDKVSPGPIGVGTRFRTQARTMGRTGVMWVELTGYDRPERIRSSIRSRSMEIEGVLTFRPVPGGTLARWSWDMRPRGPMRMIAPLVSRLGLRLERRVWVGLKRYLESPDGAAWDALRAHPRPGKRRGGGA